MEFEFARNKQVSKQGVIQLYWALQKPKAKVKRVDKNKLYSMQIKVLKVSEMSAFSTNEKHNLDNNNNNNNDNNNNFISIALLSYVQGALQLCKQHYWKIFTNLQLYPIIFTMSKKGKN